MNSQVQILKLAIDEFRREGDIQLQGVESVRSTARSILASGSLIIALISAFQIVVPTSRPIPVETYRSLFILALVLYVVMIAGCVLALWPVDLASPIKANGGDLYGRLEGASELEAGRILLAAYREAGEKNRAAGRRIRGWTTLAAILLPVIVIVLIFLSFNIP